MIKLKNILLEDDFGKQLFGSNASVRSIAYKGEKSEKDTPEENYIYQQLQQWFQKSDGNFLKYGKILLSLKDKYPEVLKPIEKYMSRVSEFPSLDRYREVFDIIESKIQSAKIDYVLGKMIITIGGLKLNYSPRSGISSWTVNKNTVSTIFHSTRFDQNFKKPFGVIRYLSKVADNCVLNHKISNVISPLAEDEILCIGHIQCYGVQIIVKQTEGKQLLTNNNEFLKILKNEYPNIYNAYSKFFKSFTS